MNQQKPNIRLLLIAKFLQRRRHKTKNIKCVKHISDVSDRGKSQKRCN